MGRVVAFGCALFCLFVGTTASAQVPVPRALVSAKTALVINHNADGKLFERFVSELQKTETFKLVGDADEADLYIFFSLGSGADIVAPVLGGGIVSGDLGTLYIHVYRHGEKSADLPLWMDREPLGMFSPRGGASNLAKRLAKAVVNAREVEK
jgi:hypothetical protein